MAHQAFDEQMAALDALRGCALDSDAITLVKKSLANKSNFLVAKAARLAEENNLTHLVPDLIAAFERFFNNGEKTDPQCWAKNALSQALKNLECTDRHVYLRGLRYEQWEPVWGGRSDSAGTLRVNCAHALVACDALTDDDLVFLLTDLLVDREANVRAEAVRALAHVGGAALSVLRLYALLGRESGEGTVMGACFSALLALDKDQSIPFVGRFLDTSEEISGEAAIALAETHSPAAFRLLVDRRKQPCEPVFGELLLSAIALTRLPEAMDYLIAMIEGEERDAPLAIEALARISPGDELRARIEQAVHETGSPRLLKAWQERQAEVDASRRA